MNSDGQKTVCILGGLGFIGSHAATRFKKDGWFVRVVDIKTKQEYGISDADEVMSLDLRIPQNVTTALTLDSIDEHFDVCLQYAAEMGGALFCFSGKEDSDIMSDSAMININVLRNHEKYKKILYSSSACIYPVSKQSDSVNKGLKEEDGWPLDCDSNYGVEKYFSERLYDSYKRNKGVDVKIVRFHNVYGNFNNDFETIRAKSPAAFCRKVISAPINGEVEVLGPGTQTRSYCWVEDAVEGCIRLLNCDTFSGPVNIGSDYSISMNALVKMVIDISGRTDLTIKNVPTNCLGVMGRNSDNTLCKQVLNWEPKMTLREGMEKTFAWIKSEMSK